MKKILGLFLGLSVLVGCSDKDKLTDEQKAHFYDTIAAVGRIPAAVNVARTNPGDTASLERFSGFLAAQGNPAEDQQTQEMAEELRGLIENGTCQVDIFESEELKKLSKEISTPGAGGVTTRVPKLTGPAEARLIVKGDGCPMAMRLTFNLSVTGEINEVTGGEQSITGAFLWDYSVKEERFKRYNAIDNISLKGDFKLYAKAAYSNGVMQSGEFDLGFNIDGKVHSLSEGDLGFYLNLGGNGALQSQQSGSLGLSMKFGIRFPAYTAELAASAKVSATPQGPQQQLAFTLNNENLSQPEFMRYVGAGVPQGSGFAEAIVVTPN